MSYEAAAEAMKKHEASLKMEIATRLTAPGAAGMIGTRIFFIVRQPDGTLSGGNVGVAENEETRDEIMRWIVENLAGLPMSWQTSEILKRPKKN